VNVTVIGHRFPHVLALRADSNPMLFAIFFRPALWKSGGDDQMDWDEWEVGAEGAVMGSDSSTSGLPVSREVIESAASGVPEAWDTIVDAYAGLVWEVARRRQLDVRGSADVCRITWMRFYDRLGLISPDAVASWLEQTAEHECLRLARLSQIGGQGQARPA
jgi:hypothetical protein